MKKLLILGLLACALWYGLRMGMERQLVGKWKCNGELTVATMSSLTQGKPKPAVQMLEAAMNSMTSTVTKEKMVSSFPGYGPIPGKSEAMDYKVVSSSFNSLTLEHKGPSVKGSPYGTIHFVSPNRIWVGGEDYDGPKIPGVDMKEWRMYYDRVN